MPDLSNLPEGITLLNLKKWENRHQTFKQKLKKKASFRLNIPKTPNGLLAKYNATTKNLQWLIEYATDKNLKLRALGSGWSMSKVAVTAGGLIDTKGLYLNFDMQETGLSKAYTDKGGKADELIFAQCGASIIQINEALEQKTDPPRCLFASGASNGQTLAGAISTGTHGGAFKYGAVHDAVVGLHLIVGKNRHVYLEKATDSVVSENFIKQIGAELIQDDDLFNAALVSFGSFGFIHGILLKTSPIFYLEKYSLRYPYNEGMKAAMTGFDFSKIEMPKPFQEADLYHFGMVVNPFDFKENDEKKGIFTKFFYKIEEQKIPGDAHRIKKPPKDTGYTYGDDALRVTQKVIDGMEKISTALFKPLAKKMLSVAYNPAVKVEPSFGTIGSTFGSTSTRGKAASMGIAVHTKDAAKVLDILMEVNKDRYLPGVIGIRFVKGTGALLGFTKFEKTCILECDGVYAAATRKYYKKVWKKLAEEEIKYTLHWGKINTVLDKELVEKMYGAETILKWKNSRTALLDEATRAVFVNEFMERCGLV